MQKVDQNNLPKLSLPNTLPPLKRRDSRSAGYTGGRVSIQAVSFPGDTGESISSSTWGRSQKFIVGGQDGGIRTHENPKKRCLSTTPFVKELVGY